MPIKGHLNRGDILSQRSLDGARDVNENIFIRVVAHVRGSQCAYYEAFYPHGHLVGYAKLCKVSSLKRWATHKYTHSVIGFTGSVAERVLNDGERYEVSNRDYHRLTAAICPTTYLLEVLARRPDTIVETKKLVDELLRTISTEEENVPTIRTRHIEVEALDDQ